MMAHALKDRGKFVAMVGGLWVLLAIAAPNRAEAFTCDWGLSGGSNSGWAFEESRGVIEDAAIFQASDGPDAHELRRADAFDEFARVSVDGTDYENPNTSGCQREGSSKNELKFPAYGISGLDVRPKLFVSRKYPLGRVFVSLTNPTAATIAADLSFFVDLGSDSDTNVAFTSSGDNNLNTSDRWSASCEDADADGCGNVSGEPDRDTEVAQQWQGKGNRKDSADSITGPTTGDLTIDFDNVSVGVGKTKSYMLIGQVALNINKAKKLAKRVDKAPKKWQVFSGLSKSELNSLQNWVKP